MADFVETPEGEEIVETLADSAVDKLAGVPTLLAAAMRKRGFTELTSVQRAVLDAEFEGQDFRISSQTGSGKTVAIGLGLARHLTAEGVDSVADRAGPSVLVLVPTRELAMQVRDELHWLYAGVRGLRTEVVMGGTSIMLERRALARQPRIVVGTPGRTLDHMKSGALKSADICHVALDESNRMLDMGFREELEAILEQLPKDRRTHLISATFPAGVRKLADRFQKNALHIEGTRLGAANNDIEHAAHILDRRESYAALVNLLLLNEGARCLIFVERRVDATSLAAKLSGDGFPVQSFSGELPQAQRTRTIEAFRAGAIQTLVSTDVAARGIDVPDIDLVIHVDPPGDADSYVHRSGRTGRAGRTGRSVMLVPPKLQRQIVRLLGAARIEAQWKPAPSAEKVRKQLRKRFRQQIHERLANDETLSQTQIDYAKGLLDGRDPAAVVSLLLEFAQPKSKRQPMNIREPRNGGAPSASAADPGFVRFSINWGEKNGAAANRLLGHICRRGQVKSQLIGSIDIGHDSSTFDVETSVASRFEKLVQRRDARDPHLRIVRAGAAGGNSEPTGRKPFPKLKSKKRFDSKRKRRG
ncbi:MAG: DEAD/DEAH box helicase [Myxococcales bacterium]|nr:DEAD/DEAH box helicase [Myxococcales bacterium]